jgi:vacuolar-type H+-ATPase subunit F/Vma7
MKYEICVIGSEALLFPFLQFGFTTYTPSSVSDLRDYLSEVIEKDYGIIYIEDSYCFEISDIIEKSHDRLTPVFIPIGENEEGASYSREMVKKMMENAVGQSIL